MRRCLSVADQSAWLPNGDAMGNNELQQSMRAILQADEVQRSDCAFCRHGFLAILSHELRNPLSALSNSLYVLKNSQPGEQRALRAMAVMDRQIQRLASLIDNLSEAATVGRGRVELHRMQLDLCEFLHNTVADHEALFANHGLKLLGQIPTGPVFIFADRERLAQILGNLLQNATQFTPQGGRVILALEADMVLEVARIKVRDSGIGIDPVMRDRLFLPFSQADTSLARTAGGLGLGLALTRGLVNLHGGSIHAESPGAGQGTTFTVELPLPEEMFRMSTSAAR